MLCLASYVVFGISCIVIRIYFNALFCLLEKKLPVTCPLAETLLTDMPHAQMMKLEEHVMTSQVNERVGRVNA